MPQPGIAQFFNNLLSGFGGGAPVTDGRALRLSAAGAATALTGLAQRNATLSPALTALAGNANFLEWAKEKNALEAQPLQGVTHGTPPRPAYVINLAALHRAALDYHGHNNDSPEAVNAIRTAADTLGNARLGGRRVGDYRDALWMEIAPPETTSIGAGVINALPTIGMGVMALKDLWEEGFSFDGLIKAILKLIVGAVVSLLLVTFNVGDKLLGLGGGGIAAEPSGLPTTPVSSANAIPMGPPAAASPAPAVVTSYATRLTAALGTSVTVNSRNELEIRLPSPAAAQAFHETFNRYRSSMGPGMETFTIGVSGNSITINPAQIAAFGGTPDGSAFFNHLHTQRFTATSETVSEFLTSQLRHSANMHPAPTPAPAPSLAEAARRTGETLAPWIPAVSAVIPPWMLRLTGIGGPAAPSAPTGTPPVASVGPRVLRAWDASLADAVDQRTIDEHLRPGGVADPNRAFVIAVNRAGADPVYNIFLGHTEDTGASQTFVADRRIQNHTGCGIETDYGVQHIRAEARRMPINPASEIDGTRITALLAPGLWAAQVSVTGNAGGATNPSATVTQNHLQLHPTLDRLENTDWIALDTHNLARGFGANRSSVYLRGTRTTDGKFQATHIVFMRRDDRGNVTALPPVALNASEREGFTGDIGADGRVILNDRFKSLITARVYEVLQNPAGRAVPRWDNIAGLATGTAPPAPPARPAPPTLPGAKPANPWELPGMETNPVNLPVSFTPPAPPPTPGSPNRPPAPAAPEIP